MRKRIIGNEKDREIKGKFDFLDVEHLAEVEVSSEDPEHPVEHALLPQHATGWRAGESGPQTLRLWFDEAQEIRRVYLHFTETETERTQEFVLRWAASRDESPVEIHRQRWNFSPSGSTHEIEDYSVHLEGVSLIELEIIPSVSGGSAVASLQQFYLARAPEGLWSPSHQEAS
jgi:hypothetical protein